jgi:hypothetical protein
LPALFFQTLLGQPPQYIPKHFVSEDDPKEFSRLVPVNDGLMRTYLLISPELFDLDENNTTHIRFARKALVCIEGEFKNGKRDGVFSSYVIDSLDHKRRYKIWEQTYSNNKLNGQWRVYNLKGNLVSYQTYANDSLNGIARTFWIDGKTILEEKEYLNGANKYIQREYNSSGRMTEEIPFENSFAQQARLKILSQWHLTG